MTAILGISAFYHDSAAALIVDGKIVAAAQEERFTRKKHDARFPSRAIEFCLSQAGITAADLDHVGFYEKPLLKFDRLLETYLSFAPEGFWSFRKAMPEWSGKKLQLRREIRRGLDGEYGGRVCFCEHHQSHAASAFFPSPFDKAALLTMDGVGEWATTTMGVGNGNRIELTDEIRFPHSLGLLYSAFTYYTGFEVNSGEYKLMGLAPYGEPKYVDRICEKLITIYEDGSYQLHLEYFNYCQGLTMTSRRFDDLFGRPRRQPDSPIEQLDMDLAASIQKVTEEVVLRSARHLHAKTGMKNLCMAGGVALNCVANGRLLREGPFENIWIQPAAGDAGGALGVAMFIWHQLLGQHRQPTLPDGQSASLLGPSPDTEDIIAVFENCGAEYQTLDDTELKKVVAGHLASGKVVGRASGAMEFGPRALGNRSILADARHPQMQSTLNLKIKFRESFRPFAPIVLSDRASEYFQLDTDHDSPYMLVVCDVNKEHQTNEASGRAGLDRVNDVRSSLPAITHVNHSARIQTVDDRNLPLRLLLSEFSDQTQCPVLVNTSFNVRDEPIVCSAVDAFRCFMATNMDVLVIENLLLEKTEQGAVDMTRLPEIKPLAQEDEMTDWQISQFVLSLIGAFCMLGAIAYWSWQAILPTVVFLALAATTAVIGCASASARRMIHDVFKQVTFPIRWILTLLALGIVYFGVLTPIGLIRRLGGHGMKLRSRPESSAWSSRKPRDIASYFNTY
ncbi:MAG: carbamoyltransferase [Rubripirellula sp.]